MIITKLQVEEGFLDGLSVEFAPGLNVVIGPRGVGKTSLIELLRFAFGVAGYTDRSSGAALAHARSVLAGGLVTVTVEDRGEVLTFVRGAGDAAPRVVGARQVVKPIILSQNEVEQIGLEPASRMSLLDGFRPAGSSATSAEDSAESMVASLTAEIQSVARAARTAEEKSLAMSEVESNLEQALLNETQLSASVASSEPERLRLGELSNDAALLEVRRQALEKARTVAAQWVSSVVDVRSRAPELQFPTAAGDRSAIRLLEEAVAEAVGAMQDVADRLAAAMAETERAGHDSQRRLVAIPFN